MRDLLPATAVRLESWRKDPAVLGVVLVGSVSRGHDDALSDDDLEVLVTEETFTRLAPADCIELAYDGEGESRRLVFDAQITTLRVLEAKAASAFDLDHWPYERARVLFDAGSRVAHAVAAAGVMDDAFRIARLRHATIDAGVSARRAEKTLRRGLTGGARSLVARGARALARIAFALERRWTPLDHWLDAELKTLDDPARVGSAILEALGTGSPAPLSTALERLEPRLVAEGVPARERRLALFLEILHPSRAEERARHGLF